MRPVNLVPRSLLDMSRPDCEITDERDAIRLMSSAADRKLNCATPLYTCATTKLLFPVCASGRA